MSVKPPNPVSGSGKDAAWLNQLLRYVKSLRPLDSPGTVTKHTTKGVIRTTSPGKGGTTVQSGSGTWV